MSTSGTSHSSVFHNPIPLEIQINLNLQQLVLHGLETNRNFEKLSNLTNINTEMLRELTNINNEMLIELRLMRESQCHCSIF